jgi:hypothetical protein
MGVFAINKCVICAKFKKWADLICMGGENDETWLECRDCMSQSDFETFYPGEARNIIHR